MGLVWVGWVQKVNLFSFLKVVMLHNQINQNEAYNTMHASSLPYYTPLTLVWGQKVKRLCCISHYAIKMFDIMHTPGLLGWVKKMCR